MCIIPLPGRIQLEFASGNRSDISNTLVLTKFPLRLVGAVQDALRMEGAERVAGFKGENYEGRACVFLDIPVRYALVFQFSEPKPAGYLIHLSAEGLRYILGQLDSLPVSPHPTD